MTYVVLQVPNYVQSVLEEASVEMSAGPVKDWLTDLSEKMDVETGRFFIFGKVAIIIMFAAAALSFVKKGMALGYILALRWGTAILSAAYSIYVFFHKILPF